MYMYVCRFSSEILLPLKNRPASLRDDSTNTCRWIKKKIIVSVYSTVAVANV